MKHFFCLSLSQDIEVFSPLFSQGRLKGWRRRQENSAIKKEIRMLMVIVMMTSDVMVTDIGEQRYQEGN
ncbi:hypothetical protein RRG08_017406 [Elysia crispata]|uniref:Uncharacterized protein n=1 Tax=Elysia crispata TaxID=231223 RepID=A0AAE0ZQM3_9GAST|nr:hypothetical protein RRG08_017406 [Elysia crispata]